MLIMINGIIQRDVAVTDYVSEVQTVDGVCGLYVLGAGLGGGEGARLRLRHRSTCIHTCITVFLFLLFLTCL